MSEILRTIKRLADSSADVLGVIGGVSALKGSLRKVAGTGKKEGAAEDQNTSAETQVRMSGLFDLSDEIAFAKVEAQMQSDPECKEKGYPLIISRFLNTLDHDFQRRKFRVVVGELSNLEYVRETKKDVRKNPRPKGPPAVEEKTVQIKANMGVDFLKSLCALENDAQRKEVCQALGVLDSISEKVGAELKEVTKVIERITVNILRDEKTKRKSYQGFRKELWRDKS